MKNRLLILLLLFAGMCMSSYGDTVSSCYDIHPVPQDMKCDNGTVSVTSEVNLVIEPGINEVSVNRIKEVLDRAGLTYQSGSSLSDQMTNIIIGENNSGEVADSYAVSNGISKSVFDEASNKYDEHLLQINANHTNGDILILGNGEGSEFYAMATLEQIFEQADGNTLMTLTDNDYAYVQYRGIVEGFYGRPYSVDTRLELMEFCKRYKMNTYIYGPKSDPYHLGLWRDDYPTSLTDHEKYFGLITQDDIRTISAKAVACNVDFVWAIHPAMQNGISFSSNSSIDQGVEDIMTKFEHMHSLGVRAFGVFIDDMSYTPSGDMQARLADQTQKKLREKFNTDDANRVAPLFFVPTAYALNYSGSYTLNSLRSVDSEVVIAFTGYDCFSNIRGSSCADIAGRIGRNATMWWNNPVNDDHDDRIYMRKLTTHWTIEDESPIPSMGGLVLNPMNQGHASKVALFSGAEYSWNPASFDDDKSWEDFFTSAIDDADIASALKIFAKNSDAITEEQSLIDMYEKFKSEYEVGKVPEVADDLLAEMEKLYDACLVLESMKDNPEKKYSLMYEDIRCWVAKLKTMSGIISDGIRLMKSGDQSLWTLCSSIRQRYSTLHTDSAYLVSAFEESGLNTYEKYYEVHPSQENMEPFVDYIAGLVDDYVITLPERETGINIITNMEDVPSEVQAVISENSVSLKGLQGITLKKNEYIGMNMNAIKDVTVSELPECPDNLEIQYSVNGKEWTLLSDISSEYEMVYLRVKNLSDGDVEIPFDEINIQADFGTSDAKPVASTNMGTWENYVIDNVVDGDKNTFFWSDASQMTGDYIMLDYGTAEARNEIVVTFNDGDQPTGTVAVELSTDGQQWNEVATFTASDIDSNNEYKCNANGAVGRYIRLYLKSVIDGNWFQVAEISVEGVKQIPQAVNEDGEAVSCLYDRKLSDSYTATKAGYVIYRFIENIKIDTVTVFHNTDFTGNTQAPKVEILANGEWSEIGVLESPYTQFDVFSLDSISELKISWDDANIPSLVEIYPEGDLYIEKSDTGVGVQEQYFDGICLVRDGNMLRVSAPSEIKSIAVWDVDGRLVSVYDINATSGVIPCGEGCQLNIIGINLEDGRTITRKFQ